MMEALATAIIEAEGYAEACYSALTWAGVGFIAIILFAGLAKGTYHLCSLISKKRSVNSLKN